MNFLELCKRVRLECGESGDGPVNVAGQTGMYAKIVSWVKSAHEEIQLRNPKWKFDWATTTQTLTAGQEVYDPVGGWGLAPRTWDWDSMYVYPVSPSERTWLSRTEFSTYRQIRIPSVQGRPVHITWAPDKTLRMYPIPNAALTFVADYYREPQVLVNNTDIPRIPEQYHMAIVWRAVMFWCASEENPALFQSAVSNFNSIMLKMETTELDGPFHAEPLA